MKKVITFSFALMASATMFAQTTLWGGEEYPIGDKGGFWDRCNQEVVENPLKDGVNTSEKCLKFTITGNDWDNGSAAKGLEVSSFDSKRLSLMIKKEKSSNVRVEVKCNGETKKVVAWYDGNGEWRKLYFDFSTNNAEGVPTEITIFPTTDNEGEQVVYLDNIQIEDAPQVNGNALSDIEDNSLSGNLKLTGAWLKGECQNADGDWQKVEYNDFATLASKLADNATSIDMRGTATKDVDVNAMRDGDKHSNIVVFADEAYDAINVVNDGKCKSLVLGSDKPFATPEDFEAESVEIYRSTYAGYNTMCLPFWVNKEDLGAKTLATYKEPTEQEDKMLINFEKKEAVDANVPFIAEFDADAKLPLKFTNKGIVNTPTEMGNPFTGTYTPGSATGLYGLTADTTFKKGGEHATFKGFSAYLTLSETQEAKNIVLGIDGEATGISNIAAESNGQIDKVYNLQGIQVGTTASLKNLENGIYVINNKKVVIK